MKLVLKSSKIKFDVFTVMEIMKHAYYSAQLKSNLVFGFPESGVWSSAERQTDCSPL